MPSHSPPSSFDASSMSSDASATSSIDSEKGLVVVEGGNSPGDVTVPLSLVAASHQKTIVMNQDTKIFKSCVSDLLNEKVWPFKKFTNIEDEKYGSKFSNIVLECMSVESAERPAFWDSKKDIIMEAFRKKRNNVTGSVKAILKKAALASDSARGNEQTMEEDAESKC